ncbi:MAG: beta-ketoacyl-ACP synthase III [Lachnospiraceae bacterium]
MTTRILGTGSALPSKIVTNTDLMQIMDTSDEWIRSRTGIGARHIAVAETTTSLSVEAGKKALEAADIEVEKLDMIIVATLSADKVTPSAACEVQAILGAKNAVAFDINAACSGFLFALQTAHAYIQAGMYKHILVIGAEVLSKIMDWEDRGTCVLFGDGAGAALVGMDAVGIRSIVQGSDGSKGPILSCDNRSIINPYTHQVNVNPYVTMNGQEVFKFAVRKVPLCIKEALEKANISKEDIKYFVLHQANMRILEAVAKRLEIGIEKFPTNLQWVGNLSAASVPVLLDEVARGGMLHRGDKILLAGFGGGMTWGATVIEW